MNSAIKAGDLVAIVYPEKCGCTSDIGRHFIVEKLEILPDIGYGIKCSYCNSFLPVAMDAFVENMAVPTYRLIKIDPPALQDETENEKELAL